ncbi:hypothetical protein [Promicromonospora iranensis]|uniref:Integral membrane protein n=1 Tax=Promicromonospora iranensis TaxID=1105144 RepID=A0ABU2CLQ4_9MICO|nr:hypothetical protein [Promicromonospora iranensis]MDR7382265.1 hypothetical protein [Promicromonospora iranensis]
MTGNLALRLLGTAELASVLVLFGNLATVHNEAVSGAVGPLHGMVYLAVIVTAVALARGRHRVWLLALVPAIGGLLAERAARAPS